MTQVTDNDGDDSPLPPFLDTTQWPPETVPLATLEPSNDGTRWILSGDPEVSLVAKRLFPGAKSMGPGKASFPNTPRVVQDLCWLMKRYPIMAAEGHEDSLEQATSSAREHSRKRARASRSGHAVPGIRFRGVARPYQNEALAFSLANERVLIADDTGLGKTVEAIMLMASGAGFPALVVPQTHLVNQWVGMLTRFLDTEGPGGIRVATVRTRGESGDDLRKGLDRLPDADIIVMHYGLVSYWAQRLEERGIQTVVFDEVAELRHRNTNKYNACSRISSQARHVVGLSATPIYNYGGEIWAVMNIIDFQSLGSWDDFSREWCVVNGAHQVVTDPQALGAFMRREGMMIRRRKEEVDTQLPSKHRDVVMVDGDDGVFRARMRKIIPLLKDYRDADRFGRFNLSGRIGEEARRATGIAKLGASIAFMSALLEAGEPVVAFAFHHDVVDGIATALAHFNPVRHTGREDARAKDKAREDFTSGRSQLIIINLRSATGIDGLQHRARICVFCELDWSPAIHSQAEDRLWRDGQDLFVLCYYLVSVTGSDPDMQAKLGLKIGQAKGVMDDPFDSEERKEQDQAVTRGFVSTLADRLATEFAGHACTTRSQGIDAFPTSTGP